MATPWHLQVVRVSSHLKQQELLRILHEISGITALGKTVGDEHYLVVDCQDQLLRGAVQRLLETIDPAATATYELEYPPSPDGGAA